LNKENNNCVKQLDVASIMLYMQVDARGKGVITAAQAASFLKQSALKESVLSQVSSLQLT